MAVYQPSKQEVATCESYGEGSGSWREVPADWPSGQAPTHCNCSLYVTRLIYQEVSCAGSPAWRLGLEVPALIGQSLLCVFCVNPSTEHIELRQMVRAVPGLS